MLGTLIFDNAVQRGYERGKPARQLARQLFNRGQARACPITISDASVGAVVERYRQGPAANYAAEVAGEYRRLQQEQAPR